MKKFMEKKRVLFMCLMALTFTVGMTFTSCSEDKDEPTPEIVTDEEVYFIVGEVQQDGKSLDGVKVSIADKTATISVDGKFALEVSKKGNYVVTFEKSGYITITSNVNIDRESKAKTSVAVKQELTPKSAPVTIFPDKDNELRAADSRGVSLSIATGAVKEAVGITMEEYTPGSNTMGASLLSLSMEPEGLVFSKPAKVSLTNTMGSQIRFANMKHFAETNGVMKEVGTVDYDSKANSYTASLTGLSNHSFVIGTDMSISATNVELSDTKKIDNIGKMSAREESIETVQKYGWMINGNLTDIIRAKFPMLSGSVISDLADNITKAITTNMGSTPGVGELNVPIPFKVGGDVKVTVDIYNQIQLYLFTFPLVLNNSTQELDVPVKKYLGTDIQTTYQQGSSFTDHSGGSGK